jgi:hypothetical protein
MIVLSVPKTAILSARTTSLKLPKDLIDPTASGDWAKTATTNLTVPTLALILLHEIRLGEEGRYWGYVQSLPREVGGLPILWDEDGEERRWLKGTGADRELQKRQKKGMGLVRRCPNWLCGGRSWILMIRMTSRSSTPTPNTSYRPPPPMLRHHP